MAPLKTIKPVAWAKQPHTSLSKEEPLTTFLEGTNCVQNAAIKPVKRSPMPQNNFHRHEHYFWGKRVAHAVKEQF